MDSQMFFGAIVNQSWEASISLESFRDEPHTLSRDFNSVGSAVRISTGVFLMIMHYSQR